MGSIDVTIQTTGRLQASNAVLVRPESQGIVEVLGARAGDRVQAGDVLVQLEIEPFDEAVESAEHALTDAEFALQFAEARLAQSPDDIARQSDAVVAVARVDAAQRALDDAVEARSQSLIRSPSDGTVLEMLAQVGELVIPNQLVARIYTPGELELLADVDELDLPNVAPGATARFRPDSFPAEEIEGLVARVAPEARQQGGATVFATLIEFVAPDGLDLRPGMNATVTIVTAERTDVLIIPERALRAVGTRYFVTVVDGDAEEREVLIGQRGGGFVEIVSGLSEGEAVELR
jgi:HlyD family secretion protein